MIISLRITPTQKALIERAAKVSGKARGAFVLDASLRKAEAVLADRTCFELTPAQMERFTKALDAPIRNPASLRKLLLRNTRMTSACGRFRK